MTEQKKDIGIYMHIPFCASKCPYCDFYSLADKSMIDAFVSAAADEINTLRRTCAFTDGIKDTRVISVYFGGGTPSFIGAQKLGFLLREIKHNFNVCDGAEITAECNPSSALADGFFKELHDTGFNRISLGLQSAVDGERKMLGRIAGAADVGRAVSECKKAGIDNISLDIMIGVPGQTRESLITSLDFALSLGVGHLSVYMLSLEPGTFFYKKRHSLSLPSEDEVCDMYMTVCEYLKGNGMRHYEISNFCFDGLFSRHNTLYWEDGEYLGIGPAAHSYFNGKRFYFPRDIDGFIDGAPAVFDCAGGDIGEYIMLKLRLDTGVSLNEINKKYGVEPDKRFFSKLDGFVREGLVRFNGDCIALTEKGFLLSNAVIGDIIEEFI